MDLREYINQYEGYTRLLRLLAIADKIPSLNKEALLLSVDEAKNLRNVEMYRDIVKVINNTCHRYEIHYSAVVF